MAFAEEWFAYYQHWPGAKAAQAPMKEAVIGELLQHAANELRHADMAEARIIQLGATPVTEPENWYEVLSYGDDAPTIGSLRQDYLISIDDLAQPAGVENQPAPFC